MKKRSPTIRDVARRAGVSIATVSRVVNGNYYVRPEVTKVVTKVVRALGYTPDPVARSLKGASSSTIGFLVSDISNSYFTLVARAIEDVIHALGYSLIVCSTEGLADRELSSLKTLLSKRVDGFVVNTTGHNDRYIESLSQTVPTILLHRKLHCGGYRGGFVDSDNRQGAATLTRHLRELGHVEVGVIGGPMELSSGEERFQGFRDGLGDEGVAFDVGHPNVYLGDFTADSGYRGMCYFRRERPEVTAVAVMNNAMTVGALTYLREHRVAVPREVSLVCFGDIVNRQIMYVRPTIVSLDPRVIGTETGRMLLSRIREPDAPSQEFIYHPRLLPGDSVLRLRTRRRGTAGSRKRAQKSA